MRQAEQIRALEGDLAAARRERDDLWEKQEALRTVLAGLLGLRPPAGSELSPEGQWKTQPLSPRQTDKFREAFRKTGGAA